MSFLSSLWGGASNPQFLNVGALWHNIEHEHPGSWSIAGHRLPDIGLTEFIKPVMAQGPAPSQGSSGGTSQAPPPNTSSMSLGSLLQQAGSTSQPSPNPQPSGGGSGGGQPDYNALISRMVKAGHTPQSALSTIQSRGYEEMAREYGLLQSPPSQPNIDWDAVYAPAFEAYKNLENTLKDSLNETISTLQKKGQQEKQSLQTFLGGEEAKYNQEKEQAAKVKEQAINEAKQVAQLGETKQKNKAQRLISAEEARTRSAIEEARRGAAQAMRAMQALYGASSSAGPAFSQIASEQALRNIGKYRQELGRYGKDINSQLQENLGTIQQALQSTVQKNTLAYQNTVGKIDTALENLRKQIQDKISEVDTNTQALIAQARQTLAQKLAQIGLERGTLETQKAQRRIEALREYQQQVQQIKNSNTQFLRQLYLQQQQAENALQQMKAKAAASFVKANMQPAGLTLPEMMLAAQRANLQVNPEAFQQLLQQAVIAQGGRLTSPDVLPKGVIFQPRKKKEETAFSSTLDLTDPKTWAILSQQAGGE